MTLTRDLIMTMPADGMMDACIWVDVFGGGTVTGKLPPFSTDIKAAWDVVEKLKTLFNYRIFSDVTKIGQCHTVHFYNNQVGSQVRKFYFASAETVPLAICRAALLAVQSASPTHDLP